MATLTSLKPAKNYCFCFIIVQDFLFMITVEGMEGLIRKISEMKLSMEIIDGYNDNAKDYCESLLERVNNGNTKKNELDCLLNQYHKELEEQEVK